MKKYSDMIPKKIRKQPSAIRRLRFISISRCVVIGIETNDRKPPMTRMSPSIKLPTSLSFDINKLNHIFHNNLFGGFSKKSLDYLVISCQNIISAKAYGKSYPLSPASPVSLVILSFYDGGKSKLVERCKGLQKSELSKGCQTPHVIQRKTNMQLTQKNKKRELNLLSKYGKCLYLHPFQYSHGVNCFNSFGGIPKIILLFVFCRHFLYKDLIKRKRLHRYRQQTTINPLSSSKK